ncbi:MAG: pilus assembly protein [Desulfuromonadaceae bacterium]
MKTIFVSFGIALLLLCLHTTQTCYAVSINTQYSCAPPFIANVAKPNIHFVLDATGSMKAHPYSRFDGTYDTATGYWGYFKQDKYYKYDVTADNYWQENSACTDTDLIGTTTQARGTCVSGKLLNYVTSNKYDIMRKVLTGGRIWVNPSDSADKTVLEHELAANENYSRSNLSNEATTNCSFNLETAGKVNIFSPNPSIGSVVTTISSSSTSTFITVASVSSKTTFTRSTGSYTTTGVVPGTLIVTSGFSNAANNNSWIVESITSTKITVTTNTGVAENLKRSVTIKTAPLTVGPVCKVLAYPLTLDKSMTFTGGSAKTITAAAPGLPTIFTSPAHGFSNGDSITIASVVGTMATKVNLAKLVVNSVTANTFAVDLDTVGRTYISGGTATAINKITRLDGGSFVTDGWVEGMSFDADGFATSGNNAKWTIATGGVTASVLTITSSGLTDANPKYIRLTQNLTAWIRVKSTTPTDFTGIIQSIYNGPGDEKTKADIELSFFDTDNKIDYTGGTTANSTVKNQPLANYIAAINGTASTGSTNTGPALAEAEKFFKQVAVASSTVKPSSGTLLIAAKNGASDPFYEPPLDGTAATNTNSPAAPCRKAFVVLVSDGEWNDGVDPVGPAYNMHRKDLTGGTQYDLRPDTAQPALPGVQAVTTYAVYAFGESAGGRNALITTAIFGGFDDVESDKNNLPYPFTSAPGASTAYTTVTLKTAANTTGYTDSRDVAGTTVIFTADDNPTFPLDECNPAGSISHSGTGSAAVYTTATWNTKCSEWDKSPGPTADLPTQRHTGLPYNYFEPTDGSGEALAKTITDAITAIFAKVSSGTAASILSNSEGTGANLLQAVYYPSKVFPGDGAEVVWVGEMQNLWYYVDPFIANSTVREDTDGDRVLNLLSDNATQFFFNGTDTRVETKQDTNGDGTGDVVVKASIDPDEVKSIWRAGKQLHTRTADSRTIHTSLNGTSLVTYSDTEGGFSNKLTRSTNLMPYLQATDLAESQKIISYIRGTDQTGYRVRKGKFLSTDTATEWKLGDIISSTPRLQSSNRISLFDIPSPSGYGDASYAKFLASDNYKNRGMAYVGANDGMFHAFKLGTLTVSGSSITGSVKAKLTGEGSADGTKLGDEQWAYIPRNALPYLKYLTGDSTYSPNSSNHLYYVDGPTVLADVSIGRPTGCAAGTTANISDCPKNTADGSNWRTVLIGSMGAAGATAIKTSACFDVVPAAVTANDPLATCVKTPIVDPADATKGLGYSSYFAFDITGQYFNSSGVLANQPTLKWEFAPPGLGYSTSGAAIVRISATTTSGSPAVTKVDKTKNGKSFAVFASGPTGPVSYGNFLAKSDQNLKLFVVDLEATGALVEDTNYWVIDTGIKRAFGGSMINASVDTDRWNAGATGNYQDDVVYVGYSKANIADTAAITATTEWSNGGVIRLLTMEEYPKRTLGVLNWKTSEVITGVGSVTSGIARLQDRRNKNLWLYFGSGRFYYGGDDKTTQRYIMGVADPCYKTTNTIDKTCTDTLAFSTSSSDFNSQNDITSCDMTGKKGWYIPLELSTTTMNAERSITDPVSLTNGMVEFTTFMPAADVCKFGGDSYIWAVKFNDGCALPAATLNSKVLLQVSTGAFEEVDLKTALTAKDGRKLGTPLTGRPPTPPPPIVTNAGNKPPKKILHLQEK